MKFVVPLLIILIGMATIFDARQIHIPPHQPEISEKSLEATVLEAVLPQTDPEIELQSMQARKKLRNMHSETMMKIDEVVQQVVKHARKITDKSFWQKLWERLRRFFMNKAKAGPSEPKLDSWGEDSDESD
ncbi:hypothetical protein PRIPAC_75563 [Pristionchus pacificus]|uniref:Uncharacterized protein n=1 Tax=Pristionchus pacificus TaxID=54126 RepID=A0A2A6C8R5_PRIPA|nr:hypothetical protein PRIPAC_75563 [Pristionchus pacificus]|eukprot:PDM74496.1 hypothetical protein PRIPAC_41852 [Pristionchus pacificus]